MPYTIVFYCGICNMPYPHTVCHLQYSSTGAVVGTRQWRWQTVLRIARISSPWGSSSAKKPSTTWQALCASYLCFNPLQACTSRSHKRLLRPLFLVSCDRCLVLRRGLVFLHIFPLGISDYGNPLQDRGPANTCRGVQLEGLSFGHRCIFWIMHDRLHKFFHRNNGGPALFRGGFRFPEHEHC